MDNAAKRGSGDTSPPNTPTPNEVDKIGAAWLVQEPYDTIVRILTKLQYKAAKKDLTGAYDAANEIMALLKRKELEGRIDELNKHMAVVSLYADDHVLITFQGSIGRLREELKELGVRGTAPTTGKSQLKEQVDE